MNKTKINLLSVLAQVGFSNISKEQVRAEIENSFLAKEVVQTSVSKMLSIEGNYAVLIEKAEVERDTVREDYNKLVQDIKEIDVTQADAFIKLMELESLKEIAETKVKVANLVIQSLLDKKKSELITEVVNAYQLALKASIESHRLKDEIKQVVTDFNISLLTEVLSDIDKEMRDVHHHIHRIARETGVYDTNVNGVYLGDRDFYTTMSYNLKK